MRSASRRGQQIPVAVGLEDPVPRHMVEPTANRRSHGITAVRRAEGARSVKECNRGVLRLGQCKVVVGVRGFDSSFAADGVVVWARSGTECFCVGPKGNKGHSFQRQAHADGMNALTSRFQQHVTAAKDPAAIKMEPMDPEAQSCISRRSVSWRKCSVLASSFGSLANGARCRSSTCGESEEMWT